MSSFIESVLGVAKWIAVIVCVLVFLLSFFQNKILYSPVVPNLPKSPKENPSGYRNPSDSKLTYEDITIASSDGINIRGWLVFSPNPTGKTLIYFHENAGNIGTRLPYVRNLVTRTGCNVLLVAYQGYSDSDGVPTEQGIKRDGLAILKFAANHPKIDRDNLFILGRSLGGAVGAYVSSHPETKSLVKGLILEVTFTSIDDMVDVMFRPLRHLKGLILRNHWRSVDLIKDIECPIYFVKAQKDMLVPSSQMDLLIGMAKKHSKVVKELTMLGADHNCVSQTNPQLYYLKMNEFLCGNYS